MSIYIQYTRTKENAHTYCVYSSRWLSKKCTRNNCNEENVRSMQLVLWVSLAHSVYARFSFGCLDFHGSECFVCCSASPSFFPHSHSATAFLYLCVCRCAFFCIRRYTIVLPLYFRIAYFSYYYFLIFFAVLIKCTAQFHFMIFIFSRVDRCFFRIVFWKPLGWVC